MVFLKGILQKLFLNKKSCPLCSQGYFSQDILCPKCTSIIQLANKQEFCRKCGKFIIKNSDNQQGKQSNLVRKSNHICHSCLTNKQNYDLARGVTLYEGQIKEIIYKFKYHGQRSLAKVIARLMVEKALASGEYRNIDCIVPVPIAAEKLMIRRYNQGYLLAKEIGKIMKLPIIAENLVRVVDTPAQSKLSRVAREENLYGAFAVTKSDEFIDKKILLIDDILTTGSTVSECSRVLKEIGASKVMVLTLVTGKTSWNGGKRNGNSEL